MRRRFIMPASLFSPLFRRYYAALCWPPPPLPFSPLIFRDFHDFRYVLSPVAPPPRIFAMASVAPAFAASVFCAPFRHFFAAPPLYASLFSLMYFLIHDASSSAAPSMFRFTPACLRATVIFAFVRTMSPDAEFQAFA
jgi:hypothetical protein